MSYPSFPRYHGNYASPSSNHISAYDASRAASAGTPTSTNSGYPVSSSQQQHGTTGYSWPKRNQPSYGNMNSNAQTYGNAGWKDGQSQQPVYDYHRPQATYAASPTMNHNSHGWYGANAQPPAQSNTQALSNLAYASGLDAQEHPMRDDRRTSHSHSAPQQFNSAQRDGHGQERPKSPSHDRGQTSSNIRISQAEQRPTSSHQNLTVSAATALAGAVSRKHNSSPAQRDIITQQYPPPSSSVINARHQNPANAINDQNQQTPASSGPANARSDSRFQVQDPSSAGAQPSNNLDRYQTTETHQYAHSSSPNITLPLPPASRTPQAKPVHGATQYSCQNNVDGGQSSENPQTGDWASTARNSIEPSSGISQHKSHEPVTYMPTFVDPSQVFNPYHKEHSRQTQAEMERAKQASVEATQPNMAVTSKESSTDQSGKAPVPITAAGSTQQAPTSASTDISLRPSSQSTPIITEPKKSGDVDMASEMKAMMHRMREWKTKDPSLFQKLWDDMKKGGSSTQPARAGTPSQSPQLAQVAPQHPPLSQESQLPQPQASPDLSTLPENHAVLSRTALKTTSKTKRHSDLTTVVGNNKAGRPDLGRSPAERGNQRTKQKKVEAKASRDEAKRSKQAAPTKRSEDAGQGYLTTPSENAPQSPLTKSAQHATQAKQDPKLTLPTQAAAQLAPARDATSVVAPTPALPPISPNGGTIWPEAKRKALAEAAQKALLGLPANKDKLITAAEIHALLEQNPSYIELCAKLEERGFVFHRGKFARHLLNNVPDLSSSTQPQSIMSERPTPSTPQPAQSMQQTAPNRVITPLPTPSGNKQNGHPPAASSSYINYRFQPAPHAKTTPIRPAKSRLGVPSPNIPAPVPGSKEAKARKRDFSELVDLTQLSDDEDYVMPRKQARPAGPETEQVQFKSDISLPNVARPMVDVRRKSYDSLNQNSFGPSGAAAPLKFDPRAQPLVPQLQTHVSVQPSLATTQRSRHLLAKPLNKAEALRKSYYDPKTVARDILIAAGRHPREHPLNSHLAGLLGKHIDIDSDLSTFDWDSVDPGGPPMPVVQVVDIPAGPPRWKLGQRARAQSPMMGVFDSRAELNVDERIRLSRPGPFVSNGTPGRHIDKEPSRGKSGTSNVRDARESLARLSSQTKSLLEDSLKTTMSTHQPTRLRQIQNADEDSKTPPHVVSGKEITPHRTNSITPVTFKSPSSQDPNKRGPGRPRKSSIMDESSLESVVKRRRGRPPGAKNKNSSVSIVKKASTSSGLQVSIPAYERSISPPQYSVYACQWRRCAAKLHNLSTLRKHIAKVHKISEDERTREGQPCWWRKCRTLAVNGEEIVPQVTFNSTSDWLDHIESDHLHSLGMKLGDGPSSAQTGKPKPFEVSQYFYHHPTLNLSSKARTCSHTDPQTLARDRQIYLSDAQGRAVTAPSTKTSILDYPPDTLALSSVTMNAESNIPNRAFSKAHGNEKMEIKQSAIETLVALQKHKERVGPGLDRGGCTLVNAERRATLMEDEGMERFVDADY